MKKNVYYIIEGDSIRVTTPYYYPFIKDARNLGGEWDSSKKAWIFPSFLLEPVKKLMIKHYGETGEEPTTPYLVTANEHVSETIGPVRCGRKLLCKAWGRDSGAKTYKGVYLLEGEIDSGGSAKWWTTYCTQGTVFRTDFTELQARVAANSKKWIIQEIDNIAQDNGAANSSDICC